MTGTDRGYASLSRAFYTKRIAGTPRIFSYQNIDVWYFACCRDQIVSEGNGKGLASIIILKLFEQGTSQPLSKPPDKLAAN